MAELQTKIQAIIDENPVVVFAKSFCPHCRATKALLTEYGVKFFLMDLDLVEDGAAIQDTLKTMSGQRTVPNIYIGGKHIGGNSDLQAKKGDELKGLLTAAGAL